MTVHLISVGQSLFSPREAGGLSRDVVDALKVAKSALARSGTDNEAASAQLSGWLGPDGPDRAGLQSIVDEATPALWPAYVSAELDTFARVSAEDRPRVTGADLAVLLATDTVGGLDAAMWNAVALAGGELPKIRYLADPDGIHRHQMAPGRTSVLIVRIPGMDASTDDGFQKAMRRLGELGRALLDSRSKPVPFTFYLSGGFKAAVPYLIGLAEGLRSLSADEVGEVTAWVLHDTTRDAAIKLPLRRVEAQWIRDELDGFAATGASPCPPDGYLNGYAYVCVDGRCRLTAFGVGLLTLVGRSHVSVDGG